MLAIKGTCTVCHNEVNIMTAGIVCFKCERFYHGMCLEPQLNLKMLENYVLSSKQWYCTRCRKQNEKVEKRAQEDVENVQRKLEMLSELRFIFFTIEDAIMKMSEDCKEMEANADEMRLVNGQLRERIFLHKIHGRKPISFRDWVAQRKLLKIDERLRAKKTKRIKNADALKRKVELLRLIKKHMIYTRKESKRKGNIKGLKQTILNTFFNIKSWARETFTDSKVGWGIPLFIWFVILLYTLLGAGVFLYIEGSSEKQAVGAILKQRKQIIDLFNLPGNKSNGQYEVEVGKYYDFIAEKFAIDINLLARGDDDLNWNFIRSIYFCASTYTTLGNQLTPKTDLGKVVMVIYALFGIPLFFIFLSTMGIMFANLLKFLLSLCRKGKRRQNKSENNETEEDDGLSSSTLVLYLLIQLLYILLGIFLYWFTEESWHLFDCWYFVVGLLLTINFGELWLSEDYYLIVTIFYILFGLALTAMGIALMIEWMKKRLGHGSAKLGAAAMNEDSKPSKLGI